MLVSLRLDKACYLFCFRFQMSRVFTEAYYLKEYHYQKIIMLNPELILQLYHNVISFYIYTNRLTEEDLRTSIRVLTEAYNPRSSALAAHSTEEICIVDYNKIELRCAYLHKYAPFHTSMVFQVMSRILYCNPSFISTIADCLNFNNKLHICCLGGGPGTDLLGVLLALHRVYGFFQCRSRVLDLMSGWQDSLRSIVTEVVTGNYGPFSEQLSPRFFNWSFTAVNLLKEFDQSVSHAISYAHLITMIKFVSAAACQETAAMIKKIFRLMQPGALVLFIDNAAGGFRQLISEAANECHLMPLCSQLNYETFTNKAFEVERFGYVSCHSTTVTVQVFKKIYSSCFSYAPNLKEIKDKKVNESLKKSEIVESKPQNANSVFNKNNSCCLDDVKPNAESNSLISQNSNSANKEKCGSEDLKTITESSSAKSQSANSTSSNISLCSSLDIKTNTEISNTKSQNKSSAKKKKCGSNDLKTITESSSANSQNANNASSNISLYSSIDIKTSTEISNTKFQNENRSFSKDNSCGSDNIKTNTKSVVSKSKNSSSELKKDILHVSEDAENSNSQSQSAKSSSSKGILFGSEGIKTKEHKSCITPYVSNKSEIPTKNISDKSLNNFDLSYEASSKKNMANENEFPPKKNFSLEITKDKESVSERESDIDKSHKHILVDAVSATNINISSEIVSEMHKQECVNVILDACEKMALLEKHLQIDDSSNSHCHQHCGIS